MTVSRSPRALMKRRFPRLTVRVHVQIETSEGPREATATTLGAGGLFVATPTPLPARSRLTVSFRLPGDSTLLRFAARVAWCTYADAGAASPGMGVEFEDAEARTEHAARLEAWAARREVAEAG